jgi:hypothetical protein
MTMSAFDVYKTYLAVSSHFKNKTYDFFKYNGSVRAKESTFLARRDKYFFEKAAKKFKRDDLVQFLVACHVNSDTDWIGDMFNVANTVRYQKWRKRMESLTYTFEQEMYTLNESEENFNKLFAAEENKHPLLFRMYLRNKVSMETMVILEVLLSYSKKWKQMDDMMIQDFLFKLKKYTPFFLSFAGDHKDKWKKIALKVYD